MTVIVHGHDTSKHGATDIGLHCGAMYRFCACDTLLYRQLVSTPERVEHTFVFPFLDVYVHVPNLMFRVMPWRACAWYLQLR
jgi:hypothetical protein